MNAVFFGTIALSILFALINGTPDAVGKAALDSAKSSVDLALGLIGYIALFLGLMKVVEEAGGLRWMARIIRPLLIRLFPGVPPDHPAMGASMRFDSSRTGPIWRGTPIMGDCSPRSGRGRNSPECRGVGVGVHGCVLSLNPKRGGSPWPV